MPPLTPLTIATLAVNRLVKEEASYHRELKEQGERIKRLEAQKPTEDEDGNREYILKQERQALEETKRVLPKMKDNISDAVDKLNDLLVEEGKKGMESNMSDIDAAKEAIAQAKAAIREIS
ncbi:hypothetical protein GX48_04820 [Paracoccidioides brasiliensis]|nr:hypothetical protein GX48_04820 [Paracoccidioides brasiliensis]